MFKANWLWSVIAPALGLKIISDVLDTNSTNTRASHMLNSPAHHTCDYMDYYVMYIMLQEAANVTVITWARIHQILTPRDVE